MLSINLILDSKIIYEYMEYVDLIKVHLSGEYGHYLVFRLMFYKKGML